VGQPVEIAYSGGKDSDVILELAKMAGINYQAIYKNTTIDPPGTIKHALERGAEMIRPKQTFFQLMDKHGWPSRRARFCCSVLKEYKVLDYVVIGVRREESAKRAERYKEPEVCRVYNKKEKARQYLPILDWTLDDVTDFLKERHVTCAPVYYDESGTFHPERRLGCICCPLTSRKHRIREFEKYPNMVKAYIVGG
jgi:phosphoadenosine phosphosulfate reductase